MRTTKLFQDHITYTAKVWQFHKPYSLEKIRFEKVITRIAMI